MARIRTVKPEFWKDEELALLPRDIRLFYIGLWNEADDEGRSRANPAYLKGALFPYDDDFNVIRALQSLDQLNKIQLYESDKGEELLVVRHLNNHQKIDKRYPSKLPAPPPYKKKAIPNRLRTELAERLGASWPRKRSVKTKCSECGHPGAVCWLTKSWVLFEDLEIDGKSPEGAGRPPLSSELQLLCSTCNSRKLAESPPVPPDQSAAPPESPQQEQGTGIRDQVEERTTEQGQDRGSEGIGGLSIFSQNLRVLLSAGVAENNAKHLADNFAADRIKDVVDASARANMRNPGGWIYNALVNKWDVGNKRHK